MRIASLPRWVEVVPGLLCAASAALKPFAPLTLCTSPWEAANAVLFPFEVLFAAVLLAPRTVAPPAGCAPDHLRSLAAARWSRRRADYRRMAGMLGAPLWSGALGLLIVLRTAGPARGWAGADVSSCGCFGPVPMPFGMHVAVLLVLAACHAAVFLHEETVLAEGKPPTPSGS